jgi:molecular chaperone DnaK
LMMLAAKTTGKVDDLIDPVRRAISTIDPTQPVYHVKSLSALVSDARLPHSSAAAMIAVFAPLPARKTETFSTASDNQTSVEVSVFLGERKMAADNHLLGKFQMTGIPPAPKGVPQIELTFEIDRDGRVNVTARDLGTGAEQAATVAGLNDIDPSDVDTRIRDATTHREDDARRSSLAEARNKADALVGRAERMLAAPEYEIHDPVRTEASDAIRAVKDAMAYDDLARLGRATDALAVALTQMAEFIRQALAAAPEIRATVESTDIESISAEPADIDFYKE